MKSLHLQAFYEGERTGYRHNRDSSTSCRNDRTIDLFRSLLKPCLSQPILTMRSADLFCALAGRLRLQHFEALL